MIYLLILQYAMLDLIKQPSYAHDKKQTKESKGYAYFVG